VTLGAGKTTLVRGCLRELGVTGAVKSPTFALLEPYVFSSLNFYHFDFLEFAGRRSLVTPGFGVVRAGHCVCYRMPERAVGQLPTPDLEVDVNDSKKKRAVTLLARTELGAACLKCVQKNWTLNQMANGADA